MPKPNEPLILITDGENKKAISLLRSLGPFFTCVTCSTQGRIVLSSYSRYCSKNYKLGNYRQDLLALVRKLKPNFLVSSQEATLLELDVHYDQINALGTVLTFERSGKLDICFDKLKTIEAAKQFQVITPKTVLFDGQSAEEIVDCVGLPCIVKARRSINFVEQTYIKSPPTHYADSLDTLEKILQEVLQSPIDFMVQECISGKGIGLFYLVDSNGDIIQNFAHERILDVIPTGSASCLRKSIETPEELDKRVRQLLKALQWRGVAMVEFKLDSNLDHYLMEINGRFWGSLELPMRAGINFPKMLVDSYNNQEISAITYKPGVELLWEMGLVKRFVHIIRGRPLGYKGTFPSVLKGFSEFSLLFDFRVRKEILYWKDPLVIIGEFLRLFYKRNS